jgi:hypothetical protein
MRRLFSAIGVLACTLVLLAGLVHFDPFEVICDALDKLFGASPKWTQVTNVYRNPRTQEITHGDDPTTSLELLKRYWHECSGSGRIVFAGNSQMHSISLASGELPSTRPEKTYVDLAMDEVWRAEPNELLYRLSSSGMSYPEVLWELDYMLDDPDLRPEMVLLQMNYQSFWTGGIRDSMLPMLRRPSFRAHVEALTASGRPDAAAYEDALHRFDQVETKDNAKSVVPSDSGLTAVFSTQLTPGYAMETRVRAWLDDVSPQQHRADLKESFENVLYRGRLYLLRLKPSTARSITGSRLLAAQSAVDSIAALCTSNHVRLLLFHAPVNPNVDLYRTPEDRETYRRFVASVAARYGIPLFDFENSISAEHWGRLLNGPDPLHMGRAAQQEMAKQVVEAMNSVELKN